MWRGELVHKKNIKQKGFTCGRSNWKGLIFPLELSVQLLSVLPK